MKNRGVRLGIPRVWSPGKIVGIILLAIMGLLVGGAIGGMWFASRGLPSFELLQDYQPSLVTRVYADDGRKIGEFYVERRIFSPISRIPKDLINAVIAVEDTRFFEHPGLDVVGIFRAAWANVKRGGKFQGASTITQQLVRSLFLTPERTYKRKIRELILAIKMELVLSKDQILEMYLNQIYFGQGAYGVGSAALAYFDKDLSQITLPEAAFLAGLPKAPSTYSPYKNPELAKKRQGHVLRRMVEAGFIPAAQAEQATSVDLAFKKPTFERIGAYFLEHVRQTLVRRYGETMVYKGGLKVYTTLNMAMQREAEKDVKMGLQELDKRQGWRGPLRHLSIADQQNPEVIEKEIKAAKELSNSGDFIHAVVTHVSKDSAKILVEGNDKGRIALKDMLWARRRLSKGKRVMEAKVLKNPTARQILKSGDVIEVAPKGGDVQSGDFLLEQTPLVEGALLALDPRTGAIRAMVGGYNFEHSQFNRALLARRQPGSAFKPVIYATALQKGFTPATLILDAPVVYEEEDSDKVWKPENYEKRFFGAITLREALRHSRNAATVRLLEQIGVPPVIELAKNLGITSPLSKDLSLALGSSSVSLEEMTAAYGVFANQGLRLEPYTVTLTKDGKGEIIGQHFFEPRQVISQEMAYLVTNMMMDVIQRGTGRGAKSIGRPLAGKTGTTNSYHDAWFVGFAPNLATGVWVGFDSMKSLGKVESGAHAALPIWTRFMKKSLDPLPVMAFRIPPGIRFTEVDNKTGKRTSKPTQNSMAEVFAAGTEPTNSPPPKPSVLDFYELDRDGFDH